MPFKQVAPKKKANLDIFIERFKSEFFEYDSVILPELDINYLLRVGVTGRTAIRASNLDLNTKGPRYIDGMPANDPVTNWLNRIK